MSFKSLDAGIIIVNPELWVEARAKPAKMHIQVIIYNQVISTSQNVTKIRTAQDFAQNVGWPALILFPH